MLHKRNNSVITLTVLLAVVGVSKPAKALLLAQADGDTPTPTQTNLDLKGSGTANPDLAGSGKVNPDLEGSGTANPGVDGSGKFNPEFQDSGVVNSDIKESGEVNSDVKESGTANIDAIAQTNANPNAADTENTQGDAIATKKSNWWWWIPLIVGIPLLGLLGISSLKRGNRSDREPAIANTPSPNDPQGGGVAFDPDIDGVSPRGGATTGNLGTTSNLDGAAIATGGAALAGGAAATNRIGDRNNKDIEEVDTDRVELENVVAQPETDIDNLIVEIPSNPVNEFTTDRETKLQDTEQPTRLVDDLNDSSGLLDNISASGAALGGSAAASGFFSDREDSVEETTESVIEDNDITYIQSSYVDDRSRRSQVDEPDYPEDTVDFDRATEEDTAFETENAREFRGDYVLREEIPIEEINSEIEDDTTAIRDANGTGSSSTTSEWNAPDNIVLDSVDNTPSTEVELSEDEDGIFEQTSGFANDATQTQGVAASGFFTNRDSEQPTEVDLEDTNWVDSTTSEWNAPDNTVLDSVDSTPITEVELSEDEDEIFEQTSGFANDATQTQGVAASGFFTNRDSEQPTEVDLEDTNWVDSTTSEWNAPDNTVLDSVDSTPITEVELSEDEDEIFEQTSGFANDATQTQGVAASGFFTNRDSEQPTEVDLEDTNWVDSTTSEWNTPDNTVLDSVDSTPITEADLEREDSDFILDSRIDNDFETNIIADAEVTSDEMDYSLDDFANSDDISLDEITLDDADNLVSAISDEFSFDDTTDSSDISVEEITLDDADNLVSAISDEFSFNDMTDSRDISVEEITFDDADSSVSASSDEFSFDDSNNSTEINLDEIAFDDVDSSVSASSDEFSFDDSNNSTEINLDEITFDDADSSIDDLINSIDTDTLNQKVDLDELDFDESLERKDNSPSDLLSSKTAGITDIADEKSNDMDNISTWLDGLETPDQNTEHISEWLENLNVNSANADSEKSNSDKTPRLNDENEDEDISFQFLEDLLDRDQNANQDDK